MPVCLRQIITIVMLQVFAPSSFISLLVLFFSAFKIEHFTFPFVFLRNNTKNTYLAKETCLLLFGCVITKGKQWKLERERKKNLVLLTFMFYFDLFHFQQESAD